MFALSVIEGPSRIDARLTFEPSERGTRMRFGARGAPTGVMRWAQLLLARTLKAQLAGYCETPKRALENGPADRASRSASGGQA